MNGVIQFAQGAHFHVVGATCPGLESCSLRKRAVALHHMKLVLPNTGPHVSSNKQHGATLAAAVTREFSSISAGNCENH